jgi:hypothetical protein
MLKLCLFFAVSVAQTAFCTKNVNSFGLEVHNPELLLQRETGQRLLVHFDFVGHPLVTTEDDLLRANVSMALNGTICQNYPGSLADIQFVVSSRCLPRESFWFSVVVQLASGATLSSTAVYIPPQHPASGAESAEQITLVLPLVFNDVARSFILLTSLAALDGSLVRELLVFAPSRDVAAVQALLEGPVGRLGFPVTVHTDAVLLGSANVTGAYSYAIQMSLKLLVHRLVSTAFYLTLDADVILLRGFSYADIVDSRGRALYHHESRAEVHGWWWEGSERVLGLDANSGGSSSSSSSRDKQGFGVTPALLSTRGAELALNMLAAASEAGTVAGGGPEGGAETAGGRSVGTNGETVGSEREWMERWLNSFGRDGVVWSEYTLYALAMHHHEVRGDVLCRCFLAVSFCCNAFGSCRCLICFTFPMAVRI